MDVAHSLSANFGLVFTWWDEEVTKLRSVKKISRITKYGAIRREDILKAF